MVNWEANAISGAKEEYMKAGFNEYMTKPVDVELLDSNLIKYLPKELVKKQWKSWKNKGFGVE